RAGQLVQPRRGQAGPAQPGGEAELALAADAAHVRAVDRLRHVERLGAALSVQPGEAVADLEARFLEGGGEPVVGAGAAEGEQVRPRLEHAQRLARPPLVPALHPPAAAGATEARLV